MKRSKIIVALEDYDKKLEKQKGNTLSRFIASIFSVYEEPRVITDLKNLLDYKQNHNNEDKQGELSQDELFECCAILLKIEMLSETTAFLGEMASRFGANKLLKEEFGEELFNAMRELERAQAFTKEIFKGLCDCKEHAKDILNEFTKLTKKADWDSEKFMNVIDKYIQNQNPKSNPSFLFSAHTSQPSSQLGNTRSISRRNSNS